MSDILLAVLSFLLLWGLIWVVTPESESDE